MKANFNLWLNRPQHRTLIYKFPNPMNLDLKITQKGCIVTGFETVMVELIYMRETARLDILQFSLSKKFVVEEYQLCIMDGPHKGEEYDFGSEILYLGRDDWCDINLKNDEFASNKHCRLTQTKHGVLVEDLQSTNGVFLDGNQVITAYLTPGHSLQVGESVFSLSEKNQKKQLNLTYTDVTGKLVGKSTIMRQLFYMLEKLSLHELSVQFFGETGTGKTSFAEALHLQSTRKEMPFVAVNCGALPPSLIESALFGFEKGAFTGAEQRRIGFIEQSNHGTLFLDEIGELPLEMQPKLLSVLENKTFTRVGGTKPISVDFRLIVATHKNLLEEVKQGTFREDLFYRVSGVQVDIPSLRERKEDIPILADFLLKKQFPEKKHWLTSSAANALKTYHWPGNVRELRNVLERSVAFMDGELLDDKDIMLPSHIRTQQTQQEEKVLHQPIQGEEINFQYSLDQGIELKKVLEEVEAALIAEALQKTNGNVRKASALLDISLPWIYKRIKKYGLSKSGE